MIAVTNASGAALTIDAYDEYGIPGADNLGRFQYTGQTWIPELGLYHYKARFYSPTLGRFLQTDPIGYGDGMNVYNYVGGDPVNFTDPLGLADIGPTIVVTARCSIGKQAVSDHREKDGYRCVAIPRFNQEKLLNRDISGLGRVPQKEEPSIEMLFAHLKRILKMDRLRLRGPSGAKDEFHLAAAAENLRKMAKMIPMPSTATA